MSKHREQGGDARLPLPERQSPDALDKKILSYAQAHRPAADKREGYGWLSGLATAGVMGIAVLIALPLQDTGPLTDLSQPTNQVAAEAAASGDAFVVEPPSPAPFPAQKRVTQSRTDGGIDMSLERERAELPTASARAPALPPKPQAKHEQVFSANRNLAQQPSLVRESAATAPGKMASDMSAAANPLSTERMMREIPVGVDDVAGDLALNECLLLWESGEEETANACYATLLETCEQCELPKTLEEAVETRRKEPVSR